MLSHEDNELLCRIEGDAPMGRIMRAHWLPACLSEELAQPDGPPLKARLLGHDLVLFRDSNGSLGALDELCPHRRASLVYGRNEDCGLRCLYHGWKFAVDGSVTDMSSERPDSRLRTQLHHRAWPVREAAGFVWVWLGDPTAVPDLPAAAWAPTGTERISIVKMQIRCNWAQVLEGAIDSAHSSSLHSTDMPAAPAGTSPLAGAQATATVWPRPSTDRAPRLAIDIADWGFRYAAIRTPTQRAETHDYIRITAFIAPFTALIPPNDRYNLAQAIVPIDDTHTMFHFIAWHPEAGIGSAEWRAFCAATPGIDLGADWLPIRHAGNRYLQDRTAMAAGNFTGIKGIPSQDMAMWESMGAIADRSQERLSASDLAISRFRRQMVAAARAVADGGPAIGGGAGRISPAAIRSFEGVVPKGTDWRGLGMDRAARAA